MVLHTYLLVSLFAICSSGALNAGIILYDQAEIEAKNPESLQTDSVTGETTAQFKHDYGARKEMLLSNSDTYNILSKIGLITACGTALWAKFNLDFACILSQNGLRHRESVFNVTTSLLALPVVALATLFCKWKANQAFDMIPLLPKEERVVVPSRDQK